MTMRGRFGGLGRRLAADTSGVSMIEFALCLPVFVGMTMLGVESVNFAYANQKIGDIATLTADNLSRVRMGISEADITETLNGIKSTGGTLRFPANGRIIVSSVQPITDSAGTVTNQKIRWQRCTGALNVASTYGVQGDQLGTTGIGPTGRKIATAANTELIFVEVVYTYQHLISSTLLGARTIRGVAAMNVRERTSNDVTQTGTASSCSSFSAT
jgi:Flp pilus assembly pilin Flp